MNSNTKAFLIVACFVVLYLGLFAAAGMSDRARYNVEKEIKLACIEKTGTPDCQAIK